MDKEPKKPNYYFLSFAFSSAFLIRAVVLHDRVETLYTEDLSIWQSPLFYFTLSGVCFIVGLYFFQTTRSKSD